MGKEVLVYRRCTSPFLLTMILIAILNRFIESFVNGKAWFKDASCGLLCCILQTLICPLVLILLLPLAALSLLFLLSLLPNAARTLHLSFNLATTALYEVQIIAINKIRRLFQLLLTGVCDLRQLFAKELIKILTYKIVGRIHFERCEREVLKKPLLMTMRAVVKLEFIALKSALGAMWCLFFILSGTATGKTGIVGRVRSSQLCCIWNG